MYFEIENTPEHIRKARKARVVQTESPKEECPRLVLAPFNRPPQVVFENVPIGTFCKKTLEVYNPTKQPQQITIGRALPPGLIVHLPDEWVFLEAETSYIVNLVWSPTQPMALRDSLRFINKDRGRYDVIVVLKSVLSVKGGHPKKSFKTSPGKMKKKTTKKSPVSIYKKKSEILRTTTRVKQSIEVVTTSEETQNIHYKFKVSNKENIPQYGYQDPEQHKCPFDSLTFDTNFNTSEIFSNMRRPVFEKELQQTYDKSEILTNDDKHDYVLKESNDNILKQKPSYKQDVSVSDMFDNINFTPLKALPPNKDKLDKGIGILPSMNFDCELDNSLTNLNKENDTHSIQLPHKWLTVNNTPFNPNPNMETLNLPTKKIPNTSSPKEFNSPNFSINTEYSRISDLSFFPQRFSTERKVIPKINNETQEIIDITNVKLSSDTYTKDSHNPSMEYYVHPMGQGLKPEFTREQSVKMCRQSLFKEQNEMTSNNYLHRRDHQNPWSNDPQCDQRSPPRSISPLLLQCIPEESAQFSETQVFDRTDRRTTTFSINRTFDKSASVSHSTRETWSKKAVNADGELWKIPAPPTKNSKPKLTCKRKESLSGNNHSIMDTSKNQNVSLNHIGNVYSQSFTVDPFLSSIYFYDERAVENFEKEFKRWLNCILTPPADLDSNVEQKIDVVKAWIENRNKEVPLAPTREQVCSAYHNSHRLERVRRSARALLLSPDISKVFNKLNIQIEKKLLVIRSDRNLHLDVGLQKTIMEILLCYNPLWLRIGLETLYGNVLPLKSNSDIEGLTTFIIQRLFRNPNLKNKHSKSSAPNMLLPAYMEAIKKFTLKKFLMLVFFLDQAKQKKLIAHDPCLFCRNAVCKESREIVIRFTRELIAGIGDITKHLRPLGYVVTHKQSYLDEYKFAVHNIAIDIRDGVRLTKVMEIILMKEGLLRQLRTPAISRLQKVHNVQVVLNALKDANFEIAGDIAAADVADGHREKTLSLLWQLIHKFRAPLFEKAASVIQFWWRQKFEVIMEKRREEQRVLKMRDDAARSIQYWWRCIQYNRMIEARKRQVTAATITLQKYFRMWYCRKRMLTMKRSVQLIIIWYRNVRLIQEAKEELNILRLKKEELRRKSVIILQSYVRRWICIKEYKLILRKVVLFQSFARGYLARKQYAKTLHSIRLIQQKYKGKLLMRSEMRKFQQIRTSALIIQSYYRMWKQHSMFQRLKKAVHTIEERYVALLKMRVERNAYQNLKRITIQIQATVRCKIIRSQYLRLRINTIKIQSCFRAKTQRSEYILVKNATTAIQRRFRGLLQMRQEKFAFIQLRNSAIVIQRRFRAQMLMRRRRLAYQELRKAADVIQTRYKALVLMRKQRAQYIQLRSACVVIQNMYRTKRARHNYLRQKESAVKIQAWYTACKKASLQKQQFTQLKQASTTIQIRFRAKIEGRKQRHEYVKIKTATIRIQKYIRCYIETKTIRRQYIELKQSTIMIQRFYRSYLETKKQRKSFLQLRTAATLIQCYFRCYQESKLIRQYYENLRKAAITIQTNYRALCDMKRERQSYIVLKRSVITVQRRYRALVEMRVERRSYLETRSATIAIQRRWRAILKMKEIRLHYLRIKHASSCIQSFYRAYEIGKKHRMDYLQLKQSSIILQRRYRALIAMKKKRNEFLALRSATVTLQTLFRARCLMKAERATYLRTYQAIHTIQRAYRAYRIGKREKEKYLKLKKSCIIIQKRFREFSETRKLRRLYLQLRNATVFVQRLVRANRVSREKRREKAANKIAQWYVTAIKTRECRQEFLKIKTSTVIIQSVFRMLIERKRFLACKTAATTIQRYYRNYRVAKYYRQQYLITKTSVVILQAYIRCFIQRKLYIKLRKAALVIQAAYRLKRSNEILKEKRVQAVIIIQKNIRRYLVQSQYLKYRGKVIFIQKMWKGKLITRLIRCAFLQKKTIVIKLQAHIRGYIVRRQIECKKEQIIAIREEKRKNTAATKIQAAFRGHRVRKSGAACAEALRRRWHAGALRSTQPTLAERHVIAMHELSGMTDLAALISAFRSLELLTEILPKMYEDNAPFVVDRVYLYMSLLNRSISSVIVLKSAAVILVNLTRYKETGPRIYLREQIRIALKYMWRFGNSESYLFCALATYIWLFSKYDGIKQDLTEFLHMPENNRILQTIKSQVYRTKKMIANRVTTPYKCQTNSMNLTPRDNLNHSSLRDNPNLSICNKSSFTTANHSMRESLNTCNRNRCVLPTLEPDYGIIKEDKPRYFIDPEHAITCIFDVYSL